LLGADKESN